MATKESYPIYSMICYTVVAVGLYSIYANYTDRNPARPKQTATPTAVVNTTPVVEAPKVTPVVEAPKVTPVELVKGWGWTNPSDMFLQLKYVKIKNNTNQDIKDPVISCSAFGESGTRIDSNTREQFKIIKAGETLDLGTVDMGFLRSQSYEVGCSIKHYKKI